MGKEVWLEKSNLTERLIALWDHLKLNSAHLATQFPTRLLDLSNPTATGLPGSRFVRQAASIRSRLSRSPHG